MKNIRRILLIVLTIGTNGFGGATASTQEIRTTTGIFTKFIWSDYLYLILKESSGKEIEYYCNIPKCAEWEIKEGAFKGKRVTLKWRDSEFFIRELNQKKRILEAVDLELKK